MEAGNSTKSLLVQAVNQLSKIEESALLIFPEDEPDPVIITDNDMRSLQPTMSLSSTIIDFYIRYLQKEILPSGVKDRFYFFNHLFFSELVETRNVSDAIEYEQVRKWTGKVNLFEKDYIFMPIHVGVHWSVIIICDLSSLTRSPLDESKGSPRIFHLDSSRGRHENLGLENYMRRYIFQAWTERYQNPSVDQLLALSHMKHVEAKVPQQDNENDSGVYMLHYIEFIILELASPDSRFGSSGGEPIFTLWDSSEVLAERNRIRDLILKLCGMNQLQLTLRLNYHEILSAISEGLIKDLQIKYPTAVHAQGAEIMDHGDYQTAGENMSDDEQHDGATKEHAEESAMGDIAQMEQHGTKVVLDESMRDHSRPNGSIWIQADSEVTPFKHSEQHGKERNSSLRRGSEDDLELLSIAVLGEQTRALSKKNFISTRPWNWSHDETTVLLSCIDNGNRFRKGNGIDWNLVAEEIYQRVGTWRSKQQMQNRYDTLWKAFKAANEYCMRTGKAFSEITGEDLRVSKMATTLTLEWYNIIERLYSRKERKRGKLAWGGDNGSLSLSPSKSPPRSRADVRTENVSEHTSNGSSGFISLLLDDHPHATTASTSLLPIQLDRALPKTGPPRTDLLRRGIYQRSVKNKDGKHVHKKYEPRFKPPREKLVSGQTLAFNYLPLGQYDTMEDARAVHQIAAFYYGKDEGRLYLGDGRYFTIPEMVWEEQSLCGYEKRSWVTRKVKEVYKEYEKEKDATVCSSNHHGSFLSREVMEPVMEPVMEFMMPSVGAALKIIRKVTATTDNVCVNKDRCKRLAKRFWDISKALEVTKTEHSGDTFLDDITMHQILTVLLKGEALVRDYADERKAVHNVIYRADNSEVFKKVHEEIDALGTYLDLGLTENIKSLSSDVETDRREIIYRAHKFIVGDIFKDGGRMVHGDVEGDLESMEEEITEECFNVESNAEDLSYLNIPFSEICLGSPIKELKPLGERVSQADAHFDGMKLVHKGRWSGCDCAIKVFKSKDIQWNTQELHKEIASLLKLRHPHVTQLIGCGQYDNITYVLYEMMDSDLRCLIESRMKWNLRSQDNRPFSRVTEISIITQIATGMFYLHENGLVHGELKCTNLLVRELGHHIDVKVADFHCSRQLGKVSTNKYKPAHRPRWMPPEAFQHYNVDQPSDDLLMKGDVYSFAMTCYEVVTGKYPFDSVRGDFLEEKIKAGERPELPQDLSNDLKGLISKCWHEDPEQRPSFQDICYVLAVLNVDGCADFGVLEGKEWSDLFPDLNELTLRSTQEIDEAAKDLPRYLEMNPFDLKPVRPLSNGASAEVFEASWKNVRCAVKWLKVDNVAKLRNELRIMMTLLHPHVMRLVGFSVLSNRCAIVMELMDTTLRDLMNSRINASKENYPVPFSESDALGIIKKLALGIDFLHSRGVIHGDLKCANVLVRSADSNIAKLDVKITNFGLSPLLAEGSPFKHTSIPGRWLAPEVILSMVSKDHVDIDLKAADVYSFAMVCYEVITGKMPFEEFADYEAARAWSVSGRGLNFDNVKVRPDLKRLLLDCWSRKPEHRPKFDLILKRLTQMSTVPMH